MMNNGMITTPAATASPRQYVASMIEELARKGMSGDHILLMIERQALGYSQEEKKIVFFRHLPLLEVEAA